jgi:hypothetical protein
VGEEEVVDLQAALLEEVGVAVGESQGEIGAEEGVGRLRTSISMVDPQDDRHHLTNKDSIRKNMYFFENCDELCSKIRFEFNRDN